MKYLKTLLITSILFAMAIVIGVVIASATKAEAGDGGINANRCEITSQTAVLIGNQASTQIFATSSRRAWARIEIGNNATNTVFVRFNDVAATVNQGLALGIGNNGTGVATSTPVIDFGLNTDFPYTGAVKAITNNGTTTVFAVECVY